MFDPNLPQEHTLADAAQMRAQLTGLKDLIDAVPAISSAQVDGVTLLDPADPAVVNLSVVGSVLHFSFGIPRGHPGAQGPPFAANGTYDVPQMQAVIDKLNELIAALRR